MRKILIIGFVLLLIFLIYLANMDKKVYYVALGDSLEKVYLDNGEVFGYSHYIKDFLKNKDLLERYSDDFAKVDTRSTDIINDINENRKVKTAKGSFSLKNALIKADLVTLNISNEDVYEKLRDFNIVYNEVYDYIDDLAYDLDRLFSLMREYCKEDIVFIGIYNPFFESDNENISDVLDYLNKKYKDVCTEYDVTYIDISDVNVISKGTLKEIGNKVVINMSKKLFET